MAGPSLRARGGWQRCYNAHPAAPHRTRTAPGPLTQIGQLLLDALHRHFAVLRACGLVAGAGVHTNRRKVARVPDGARVTAATACRREPGHATMRKNPRRWLTGQAARLGAGAAGAGACTGRRTEQRAGWRDTHVKRAGTVGACARGASGMRRCVEWRWTGQEGARGTRRGAAGEQARQGLGRHTGPAKAILACPVATRRHARLRTNARARFRYLGRSGACAPAQALDGGAVVRAVRSNARSTLGTPKSRQWRRGATAGT